MEHMLAQLENISGILWGWPTLVLLVGTGLMMTITLRAMPWWRLPKALWAALGPQGNVRHGKGTISNRAALMTALAATVGTGNIAGVATALALGGPGAMFWMWVSGLLGMAVKYSEALLGVHYREKKADGEYHGGPMFYLSKGLGSPKYGMLYGVLLAFGVLVGWGMVQSNSIADAMRSSFGISPTMTSATIMVLAAIIMFGGLKSIARTADKLVPLMIVIYLLAGTAVLLANAAYVPAAFKAILEGAFSMQAVGGGAMGLAIMQAMRYGLARGVFSNESGLGSAAIVAATAQTKHPVEQALVSMTQTFIDTIVVCTFTGLVILVSGATLGGESAVTGAALTSLAFGSGLGNLSVGGVAVGEAIVAISLALFAFTTILGGGYYGQQAAIYVFGPKMAKPYLALFMLSILSGGLVLDMVTDGLEGVHIVWALADIGIALMIYPNLLGLWLMRKQVARLTWDYLAVEHSGGTYKYPAFYEDRLAAKPAKSTKIPAKGGKKRK